MEIEVITLGHIAVNCYMVSTEKAALVIDPGFKSQAVMDFLFENESKERLILLTHAHFDHIGGALELKQKTATDIAIGEMDNFALSDGEVNLSSRFHAHIEPFSADILLPDNKEITIGDLKIKTLFTPGHTVGGVSYLLDDILFSGDTLFYRSVGRTDFPGGDFTVLKKSIDRIFELDSSVTVLSGHGQPTTVGEEKDYNPYI
ncbi:MAG: MBL fold metallo-hydrolase [Acutalibacteraceae bacterium]|nr:MBL fold metallo-hydrolase [Acutalibacteraceae bacterium]